MPNYSREGKIQTPLSDKQFISGMQGGYFVHPKHKGLIAFYYYTALRCLEALKIRKEAITESEGKLFIEVGPRLKHSKKTPPLIIPLKAPWARYIWASREHTKTGGLIWPYCRKTAYNIVHRAFKYPHLFRLSRITNFFLEGWTIAQVKSWTGLTLTALDFYVGVVDLNKMGNSLYKEAPP